MKAAPALLAALTLELLLVVTSAFADPLRAYISKPEPSFAWTVAAHYDTWDEIELTSQTWQGESWQHRLLVHTPQALKHPGATFLFITGRNPASEKHLVEAVCAAAGVRGAILGDVPRQPLFEGKKEDQLIAFTLVRFLETGDWSWPALLPMVKSATAAFDALDQHLGPQRYIVSGSSKRGWTTWLLGATDKRVAGIAPRVFDMLNMTTQLTWAARVYGRQSEKIKDYVELGLVDKATDLEAHPRMRELLSAIDPFSRRSELAVPKLIMLGTNDRYWVVDATRHYWDALKGERFLQQSPNVGHSLKLSGIETLAAFTTAVARKERLPSFSWRRTDNAVSVDKGKALELVSYRACVPERDFRDAFWREAPLISERILLPKPSQGSCAVLIEARFAGPQGPYSLSSEVFVVEAETR